MLAPRIGAADPTLGGLVVLAGAVRPLAESILSQTRYLAEVDERDYQVTMDDFAAWRAALGNRADVRLTSYPTLNHLLMSGSGRSTPAAYRNQGHVDEAVVCDIAAWVTGR